MPNVHHRFLSGEAPDLAPKGHELIELLPEDGEGSREVARLTDRKLRRIPMAFHRAGGVTIDNGHSVRGQGRWGWPICLHRDGGLGPPRGRSCMCRWARHRRTLPQIVFDGWRRRPEGVWWRWAMGKMMHIRLGVSTGATWFSRSRRRAVWRRRPAVRGWRWVRAARRRGRPRASRATRSAS